MVFRLSRAPLVSANILREAKAAASFSRTPSSSQHSRSVFSSLCKQKSLNEDEARADGVCWPGCIDSSDEVFSSKPLHQHRGWPGQPCVLIVTTVAVESACQIGCVWEAPFPPAFPREITFHPQSASSVSSYSDLSLERRRLPSGFFVG